MAASGLFLYQIEAGRFTETRAMVFLEEARRRSFHTGQCVPDIFVLRVVELNAEETGSMMVCHVSGRLSGDPVSRLMSIRESEVRTRENTLRNVT